MPDSKSGSAPEKKKHKYKKYILFQYEGHYPSGGLNDVIESFSTIKEAKKYAQKHKSENNEVVNRDTWEIVWDDEMDILKRKS